MQSPEPFKVLIIDDEKPVLEMLSKVLSRKGYITDIAQNGEEGIEKIKSNEYHIVLTDIKMPGISGNQILEYVKTEKKSSTPVVGMSGTPWLLDQSIFDAVVPKPCSMQEITEVVSNLIKKNHRFVLPEPPQTNPF